MKFWPPPNRKHIAVDQYSVHSTPAELHKEETYLRWDVDEGTEGCSIEGSLAFQWIPHIFHHIPP